MKNKLYFKKYFYCLFLMFSFLSFFSNETKAQTDLIWYSRPKMLSTNGSLYIDWVNKLGNNDLVLHGMLGGTYQFDSTNTLSLNNNPFWARYDSSYNLKYLKPFNYSTGDGYIVGSVTDTNNNYFCNLYYASGNWKFDSLGSSNFNFTTTDQTFIAYDSFGNYIHHISIHPYPITCFNIDTKQRIMFAYMDSTRDSFDLDFYSNNFYNLDASYRFYNGGYLNQNLTIQEITSTSDNGYFLGGVFEGAGTLDLDPTANIHLQSFNSNNGNGQYFLATYDSVMHIRNSIVLNYDVWGYISYLGDHIYVSGTYTGQQLLVPSDSTSMLSGNQNRFIACFDNELHLKWIKGLLTVSNDGYFSPVERCEFVKQNTAPFFKYYDNTVVSNSSFNLDFSKYNGLTLFQMDTDGDARYIGNWNHNLNNTGVISPDFILDKNTFFAGGNQFLKSPADISWNGIPIIKVNNDTINDAGSQWATYSYYAQKGHNLEGKLIADLNYNQTIDSTDANIPYHPLMNTVDSSYTLSDNFGKYSLAVDTGNYSVYCPNPVNYNISIPTFQIGTMPDSLPVDTGKNFFFTPENVIYDLKADVACPFSFREQIPFTVYLSVTNNGSQTTHAHCKFLCDTLWSLINSSYTPTFNSIDSVTWDLPSIKPFETITIQLAIQINSITNIGDSVHFNFSVDPAPNPEYFPSDNIATNYSLYFNSYDPNEKRSNHSTYELLSAVDSSFEFNYEIHFQNTGNDTAFKVMLIDTLDANLDLLTLRNFHSSNDFTASLLYNKVLKIEFNNINLLDSGANNLASQGFFSYSIKPKFPVQFNETITNRANIFFDFNEAVLTNTTSTEFVTALGIKELKSPNDFMIYPNPTNDYFTLEFDPSKSTKEIQYIISDQIGRTVSFAKIHSSKSKINVSQLTTGMYFITVIYSDGTKITKKLIVNY